MNEIGDKLIIKIEYGDGPEALFNAMQQAIFRWREFNLENKDLLIYIPMLAQRYLIEFTAQYQTSPFKKNLVEIGLTEFLGIQVVPGYEWGKVVIAWKEGEVYGMKPIVITWDTPVTKTKAKIED